MLKQGRIRGIVIQNRRVNLRMLQFAKRVIVTESKLEMKILFMDQIS